MRQKLVFGHSPQMLTIGVVRMRYPRDIQYLGYKIRSDYDTCTSKCRGKLRYRGIDTMYIGVKILYKHNRAPQGYLTKRFPSPSLNDSRQRSVGKFRQNDMALWMNATFLKVLKEVLLDLPIMKLNVKRGNKIRRRRLRTKRVPSRSRFTLRCHAQSF